MADGAVLGAVFAVILGLFILYPLRAARTAYKRGRKGWAAAILVSMLIWVAPITAYRALKQPPLVAPASQEPKTGSGRRSVWVGAGIMVLAYLAAWEPDGLPLDAT